MFHTLSSIIVFTLILVVSTRDPITKYIREGKDGKEYVGKRDYTPSKWITNSAMDVWYGNKSMIDILWREFSDVMYKLTDRKLRSTQLEEFKLNQTHNNMTLPQIAKLFYNNSNREFLYSNKSNINNVSLYNNDINNMRLFTSNVTKESLYDIYLYKLNLKNNSNSNNVSQSLLQPILFFPVNSTT